MVCIDPDRTGISLPIRPHVDDANVRPHSTERVQGTLMRNTVAHQIVGVISELGIDRVFGIPGGLVAPIFDALIDHPSLKLVVAKHETNAVFLAMGYALATGRAGVVITTAGPGITNAFTGLASARYEGIPIIHIAGDAPLASFGRHAFQESGPNALDAVGMARHVTKFAKQIVRPDAAISIFRHAVGAAMDGVPGPVFVSFPLDIASATVECTAIAGRSHATFEVDNEACRKVAGLLSAAKKPLILAGAGCRSRTTRNALEAFASDFAIPVAVTSKGKGVFAEDHSNFLGVMGFGGHRSVLEYLSGGFDVLLVVGSSLGDFSTNAWTPLLQPTKTLIQIDIDGEKVGQNYGAAYGLVGPAELILDKVRLSAGKSEPRRSLPSQDFSHSGRVASRPVRIDAFQVMECLNEVAPADAVFCVDIGEHLAVAISCLRIGSRQTFYSTLGFGSMGASSGMAIGHQLAEPDRRVYVVCGDGGFLMNGSELATAVQHHVAATFLIINDSRLNMVHQGMKEQFGRSHAFATQVIDFSAIARGYGAQGKVINTKTELLLALREGLLLQGPLALDVRVDPEVRLVGNHRVAALKHFTHGSS